MAFNDGWGSLRLRPHTRQGTYLGRNAKVWCSKCQDVRAVVDVFHGGNEFDKILRLDCAHDRHESIKPVAEDVTLALDADAPERIVEERDDTPAETAIIHSLIVAAEIAGEVPLSELGRV